MKPRCLVFAPGYGDPSIVIDQLAKRFVDYDKVVLSYHNRGVSQSIPEIAVGLLPLLDALRAGYEHITFIGHSMGGLIGRCLEFLRPGLLDAYVSIATPHGGTYLASLDRWGISPSVVDMAPFTGFLEGLESKPWIIPSLVIAAKWDQLIFPQYSALDLVGTNVEKTTIPWTEHVTVALSERTYLEIWGWLTYAIFGETGLEGPSGSHSRWKKPL